MRARRCKLSFTDMNIYPFCSAGKHSHITLHKFFVVETGCWGETTILFSMHQIFAAARQQLVHRSRLCDCSVRGQVFIVLSH